MLPDGQRNGVEGEGGGKTSHLRTKPGRQDKDWHEGDLTKNGQDQGISQHKQFITQAQPLIQACIQLT